MPISSAAHIKMPRKSESNANNIKNLPPLKKGWRVIHFYEVKYFKVYWSKNREMEIIMPTQGGAQL